MEDSITTKKVEYYYLDGLRDDNRNLIALSFEETERWDQKKVYFTTFNMEGRPKAQDEIAIASYRLSFHYNYLKGWYEFRYSFFTRAIIGNFFIYGSSLGNSIVKELKELLIFIKSHPQEISEYSIRERPSFSPIDIDSYYEWIFALKTHRLKTSKSVVRKDNIFIDYMVISYVFYGTTKTYFEKLLLDFLGKYTYDEETKSIMIKVYEEHAWSSSFPDKKVEDGFFNWRVKFLKYLNSNFDAHEGFKYQVFKID